MFGVVMIAEQFLVLDDADVGDAGLAQNGLRRLRAGVAGLNGRAAVPGVGALDVPLGQQADGKSDEDRMSIM